MASIGSQGLNDFLYDWVQSEMPGKQVWIGGHSADTWGDWSWTDGATWSFTNWGSGYPNGENTGQMCIYMYSDGNGAGFWDDGHCSNKNYPKWFFCSASPQNSQDNG